MPAQLREQFEIISIDQQNMLIMEIHHFVDQQFFFFNIISCQRDLGIQSSDLAEHDFSAGDPS